MTDVTYAPPTMEVPKVVAIPATADPQAKLLVDNLNQSFEELVRVQQANAKAVGADLSSFDDKVKGVNDALATAADEIANMDAELKRLQAAAIARSGANAGDSSGAADPRNDADWSQGFDMWMRKGAGVLREAHATALNGGNAYHELVHNAKPEDVARPDWDPVNAVAAGGLSTVFGPGAGVWARPQYDTEITKLIVEFSPIRGFARVTTINGAEFVGTLRSANRDTIEQIFEGATPTQQTQQLRYTEKRIRPYEYWARPGITQVMREDAGIDLEAELRNDIAVDFAASEAAKFTTGSGANEPFGYATDTAVGGETSESSGTITQKDLLSLALKLRPPYRSNGSAFAFSTTAFRIAILHEDGQGRRLWEPSHQGPGLPSLYQGWPYFESTDQAAVAASSKSVFFANWREFYRIVDRRGINIIRDETTVPGLIILNHSRRYGGSTWKTEAGKALTTKA